ncbi:hypothetical protein BDR06DRAFT_1012556 [Suillus hirtellus]|nr:hypothetical protein BDR06DRAFT_1012556 [Suillus hirtellus]
MSTSMDSVIIVSSNVPDSEPFPDSHIPYAPFDPPHDPDEPSVSKPFYTSPDTPPSTHTSDELNMDLDSTDLELMLSTSTSEQFDMSDCYSSMNDCDIVNLHTITDCHTESKLFITQADLHGPGAKMYHFKANIDDGAMVNVLDLQAYRKAAQHLKTLTPLK